MIPWESVSLLVVKTAPNLAGFECIFFDNVISTKRMPCLSLAIFLIVIFKFTPQEPFGICGGFT